LSTETLRDRYPLLRAKIIKKTIVWLSPYIIIVPAVVCGILFLQDLLQLLSVAAPFFLIIIAVLVYWYQTVYYRNYFYDHTSEGLVISKGVFSTKKTIIPLNKMQDIYLDRDILDRFFGLWDLHISSASDVSGFEAHIDGVSEADGREMKDLFLSKAGLGRAKESENVETYRPASVGFWLALLQPMIGLGIAMIFTLPYSLLLTPLLLLLIPLSIFDYRVLRYELRDTGVFIRSGFIQPKESLFLYRNIQDVEESYEFFSMLFGLRSLTMKTMTSLSAKDARMNYLSKEDATHIREEILKRAKHGSKTESTPASESIPQASKQVETSLQELAQTDAAPYRNNILKSSLWSGIIWGVPVLVCVVALLYFSGEWIMTLLPWVLILMAGPVVNLITLLVSYEYHINPQYVTIKNGIFNSSKRQISYVKIQDLVVNISFPQSFINLGSLRLETGSKEYSQQGNTNAITSQSLMVEAIPDLELDDAEDLKKKIASYMGVSLQGLWKDPLVKRMPLEAIKPVKKTLWWAIYVTPVLITLLLLPIKELDAIKAPAALFCIAGIALKYLYETYYYRKYFYDVNSDVLLIKKGVFGSKEIMIPYNKIQDVFVSQDILDRLFGLKDVYVSTVSGRSILNAHIDGVNSEKAEKIALMLLDGVKKSKA
jgi:membrane protein YdbS with pleckstrin-like domain